MIAGGRGNKRPRKVTDSGPPRSAGAADQRDRVACRGKRSDGIPGHSVDNAMSKNRSDDVGLKSRRFLRAFLVATGLAVFASAGTSGFQDGAADDDTAEQRRRGEYLVHHVAMCVQCHSPRDERGRLIEQRLLQGARMPVSRPFPDQSWAVQAPGIAGLSGWTDDDVLALLTSGKREDGAAPSPPMPPFRLSEEDARAVLAYLRSLN